MIRILIDEEGDGHNDLILKVDAIPSFIQIADLYYMADFLIVDPEKVDKVPHDLGIAYINYLKDKLAKIGDSEAFLTVDISDEYIGGFLISKSKKGLVEVHYAVTRDIHGYEVDKTNIDGLIKERAPVFERERNWLMNPESILNGLNRSIEKIEKEK